MGDWLSLESERKKEANVKYYFQIAGMGNGVDDYDDWERSGGSQVEGRDLASGLKVLNLIWELQREKLWSQLSV